MTSSNLNPSSNRLLFGSCNSQSYDQVLWPHILQRHGSAFVWGGDAVYTDSYVSSATPAIAKEMYEAQLVEPGYKQLLDSGIPVLGAWDDHDYGIDNGDRTYPHRVEMAVLYACEFLKNKGKMCERAKRGEGVYGVQVMDFSRPQGLELLTEEEAGLDPDVAVLNSEARSSALGDKTVAIFLLDIRSHKTPYTKKMGPSPGDFLGETQWQWLEKALGQSTAAVNVIVSGLQVHGDRRPAESWSRFPDAQHRLYQALLQPSVQAPMIVSGDVHHAQLLRRDCYQEQGQQGGQDNNQRRTLPEITTSGMTHSWGSREQCARPHRSWLCRNPFVQWVLGRGMHLAQYWNGYLSWTEVLYLEPHQVTDKEEGTPGLQFSLDRNFAEMEFDWDERSVVVRVLGQDMEAPPLLSHKWLLDEISSSSSSNGEEGPWVCQNYRGETNSVMKTIGVVVPIGCVITGLLSPFFLALWILLLAHKRYSRRQNKSKQS